MIRHVTHITNKDSNIAFYHTFYHTHRNYHGTLLLASALRYVKRDLHIWKETYIYEKRPTVRRLEIQNKDIHKCQKRPTHIKRDLHIWKRPASKTSWNSKHRHTQVPKDLYIGKETNKQDVKFLKRDLVRNLWRKIDLHRWKKIYKQDNFWKKETHKCQKTYT